MPWQQFSYVNLHFSLIADKKRPLLLLFLFWLMVLGSWLWGFVWTFLWHGAAMLVTFKVLGPLFLEDLFWALILLLIMSFLQACSPRACLVFLLYDLSFRKNVHVILFSCPFIFTVIINNHLHKYLTHWNQWSSFISACLSSRSYFFSNCMRGSYFFSNCTRGDACILLFVVLIVAWGNVVKWW